MQTPRRKLAVPSSNPGSLIADAGIVAALAGAERELAELHRRLAQGTLYAVPGDDSLKLAV